MKNFYNINFRFLTTIISFLLLLVISACDDSFNEKIEIEKEKAIIESQKDENNNHDPKVFSPGNNGVMVVKYLGMNMVRFKWHKSRDQDSNPLDVTYSIYYSFENNIDTAEDARENGIHVFTGYNFNQYTMSDLEEDTVYYINIVAEDDDENEIAYNTISVETLMYDH